MSSNILLDFKNSSLENPSLRNGPVLRGASGTMPAALPKRMTERRIEVAEMCPARRLTASALLTPLIALAWALFVPAQASSSDCSNPESPERLRSCLSDAAKEAATLNPQPGTKVDFPDIGGLSDGAYAPGSDLWKKHKEQVERSEEQIDQLRREYRRRYAAGNLNDEERLGMERRLAEQIDKQRRSITRISGDRQLHRKSGSVEARDMMFSIEVEEDVTARRRAAEQLHAISQCDGCAFEGKSVSEIEKLLGAEQRHPRQAEILNGVNFLGAEIAELEREYKTLVLQGRITDSVRRDYERALADKLQRVRYELRRIGAPHEPQDSATPGEIAGQSLDTITRQANASASQAPRGDSECEKLAAQMFPCTSATADPEVCGPLALAAAQACLKEAGR